MTQNIEILKIANRLVSYALHDSSRATTRSLAQGVKNISIPPSAQKDYCKTVQEFYELEKIISRNYSLEAFEGKVRKFIAPFVLDAKLVDKQSVTLFLRELSGAPLINYSVFRPIHRIKTNMRFGPIVLGRFTFYNTVSDAVALNTALKGIKDEVLLDDAEHYLIHTSVEARDRVRALELADALFEQFENVIRFMLGPQSRFDTRIFGWAGSFSAYSIVMSGVDWASSISKEGITDELNIDDKYFLDAKFGFDIIWKNLGKSSLSQLMKKIFLSVNWVGQSIDEKIPSSGFLKAAIALEILFTPEPGMFAPSIVSQITENIVLLLGADATSRFELEQKVKHLYGIRSKVAHTGRTDIAPDDLLAIQELVRQTIFKLLTTVKIKECSTSEDLSKVLKSLKYSCPPIS